jgi:cytochrome c
MGRLLTVWLLAEIWPLRAGEADAGRRIFAACSVCHETGPANKVGPGLSGIVGRKAGTAGGFRYSRAMKRSKIVWNEGALQSYLADPQGAVPGNAMAFPGIPDQGQRKALIAYLKTLK